MQIIIAVGSGRTLRPPFVKLFPNHSTLFLAISNTSLSLALKERGHCGVSEFDIHLFKVILLFQSYLLDRSRACIPQIVRQPYY